MQKIWILSLFISVAAFAVETKDCPEKIGAQFTNWGIITKADFEKYQSKLDIELGALEQARELIADRKAPYETKLELYKKKNGQCLYKNKKREFARLYTKLDRKGVRHHWLHVAFPIDVKDLEMPNHEFWMELKEYKTALVPVERLAEVVITEKDEQYTVDYPIGWTKTFVLTVEK